MKTLLITMKNLLLTIGSTAIIFSTIYTAQACGPQLYTDETRFSLFNPDVGGDYSLRPFYYQHSFYNTIQVPESQLKERTENLKEWVAFGEKTFSRKGVEILQYQTAPDVFLNAYKTKNYKEFEGNDFVEFLLKSGNEAALEYFVFAKEVEAAQNFNQGWNSEWSEEATFNKQRFAELAQIAAKKVKQKKLPKFIRERYAFQLIKCAYYDRFYNDGTKYINTAIKYYKSLLEPSNSITARWALIYYAEFFNDPQQRTLLLIDAFDKSQEKRKRAYSLMDMDEVRKIAQSYPDKQYAQLANIILGLSNTGKGLDLIQKIQKEDPDNHYLPLLISREINKLEDWISTNKYLQFYPELRLNEFYKRKNQIDTSFSYYYQSQLQEDANYLEELLRYLNTISLGENVIRKNFKEIAQIHLLNMAGYFREASLMIKNINKDQTEDAITQINYEKVISIAQLYDIKTQRAKDLMALSLVSIELGKQRSFTDYSRLPDENPQPTEQALYPYNIDPQIFVYLGRLYIEKGHRYEGALLLQTAALKQTINEYGHYYYYDSNAYSGIAFLEKYFEPEDVDSVIMLKAKPFKNQFETYMAATAFCSDEMYLDLKGTLLLRRGRYEEALAVFNQISDDFWAKNYEFAQYLPSTPIYLNPHIPIDLIQEKSGEYSMPSKKLIVKDLLELKNKVNQPNATALDWYRYANALYNISYHGTAWMAYAYGKSILENNTNPWWADNYKFVHYRLHPSPENNPDNYYGLKDAMEAYRQAIGKAGMSEVGAAAAAMLALCHKVSAPYYYYKSNPYDLRPAPASENIWYQELNRYKGTQVHHWLKQTCPDVK